MQFVNSQKVIFEGVKTLKTSFKKNLKSLSYLCKCFSFFYIFCDVGHKLKYVREDNFYLTFAVQIHFVVLKFEETHKFSPKWLFPV